MFSSPTALPRGVNEFARKIGIDPKVASKKWNTMSSYTKNVTDNFSKSRSKLSKRGNTNDSMTNNSYTTININSNNNLSTTRDINKPIQHNFTRYVLYCLAFFASMIFLNFIFTKHLSRKIDVKSTINASPN